MKNSKKIKILNGILTILTILLIIFASYIVFYYTYNNILQPAYLSYASICLPKDVRDALIEGSGREVAGSTRIIIGNGTGEGIRGKEVDVNLEGIDIDGLNITSVRVDINEGFEGDKSVLKHELVHVNQIERGFVVPCRNKYLKILGEVEAYVGQRLPDPIFRWFYGEIEL